MDSRLEALAQRVREFRIAVPSRRAVFPEDIRQEVLALAKVQGEKLVTSTCGLGSTTIYQWRRQREKSSVKAAPPVPLSFTRIQGPSQPDSREVRSGCFLEVQGIRMCIDDPVFLARFLQAHGELRVQGGETL